MPDIRRHLTGSALLLALAAGLAACANENAPYAGGAGQTATARATSGPACFRPDDVNGFTAVDDRTVIVRVGVNRVFQMQLMGTCPDVDWSMRLGLQSTASSWICQGLDATVIAPTPIGPQRCPVTAIRQLSPQEVAALPPRQRP